MPAGHSTAAVPNTGRSQRSGWLAVVGVALPAWTVAYGSLKLYWALGGTALRDTVGFSAEAWSDPWFIAIGLWGTVLMAAGGTLAALLLTRPWGRRVVAATGVPLRVPPRIAWGVAALLLVRGIQAPIGLVVWAAGGFAPLERVAGANLFGYAPWFLLGALLWGAAAWLSPLRRPAGH